MAALCWELIAPTGFLGLSRGALLACALSRARAGRQPEEQLKISAMNMEMERKARAQNENCWLCDMSVPVLELKLELLLQNQAALLRRRWLLEDNDWWHISAGGGWGIFV